MNTIEKIDNKIIIRDISKYSIHFINNNLILEEKNISDIKNNFNILSENLKHSKIQNCSINNKSFKKMKFKSFLIELYKTIDNSSFIKNSTMNIVEEEIYDRGFIYYKDLKVSIQGKDTYRTLKEIIHISNMYNIDIKLEILLSNGKIINYKN